MSTRCNIMIEREGYFPVILYHHHDGYPQGVGYDLHTRLKNIEGGWYQQEIANSLVKDLNDEYEITSCVHGDIEYLYVINCKEKTLKCYAARGTIIGEEVKMNFKKMGE